MWKLSIEDDQGQSTVVHLVRSEYGIGRTDENSIRLTERNISRKHARLLKRGAAWFLDDLGSYNGCFVNGLRVVDHHPINVGDLLQIGDYRLELLADEDVAVAPAQVARPRRADTLSTTLNLAAQTDRLVMVVGPTPGREYMLAHAAQRIGRGEECDICVNHSSVSRWHADLHYLGSSRYEIIDHDSSNGVRINGAELRRGLLDARDLVELGDVVLKFIPAGQVYRPTPEESRQLAALLGVDLEGAESQQGEPSTLGGRSLSTITRWGLALLGVSIVVLLALSLAGRKLHLESAAEEAAPSMQSAQRALLEATQLLEQGNTTAAHEKLLTIPASSRLRQAPEFARVESAWGTELLRNAELATSADERRRLLTAVAEAATVAPELRQRATEVLAAGASPAKEQAMVASTAIPDRVAAPTEIPAPIDVDNLGQEKTPPAASEPALATSPPKANRRPQTGGSARSSNAGPVGKTGVGSSGLEPNAAELATSGNLESVKAARDALRRKVNAGTATDREVRLLRALCRQLGDSTCPR